MMDATNRKVLEAKHELLQAAGYETKLVYLDSPVLKIKLEGRWIATKDIRLVSMHEEIAQQLIEKYATKNTQIREVHGKEYIRERHSLLDALHSFVHIYGVDNWRSHPDAKLFAEAFKRAKLHCCKELPDLPS